MMTNTLARIDTEAEVIRELTRRVQAEYAEMPGLNVNWRKRNDCSDEAWRERCLLKERSKLTQRRYVIFDQMFSAGTRRLDGSSTGRTFVAVRSLRPRDVGLDARTEPLFEQGELSGNGIRRCATHDVSTWNRAPSRRLETKTGALQTAENRSQNKQR